MAETVTYQCPNCNGRLIFESKLGKLQCKFCDSQFTAEEVERIWAERQAKADANAADAVKADETADEIEDVEAAEAAQAADEIGDTEGTAIAEGVINEGSEAAQAAEDSEAGGAGIAAPKVQQGDDPIDTYLRNAHWENLAEEDLRSLNCSSCGAQLLVDQVTAVTSCPYCGNNAVVPGQLADMLKPDLVIPFKLDRDAAIAALKNFYKGKRLLPDNFSDVNHIEEIQGVYVPFWLYSGRSQADVTFNARNIRTWSDSKNNYVETDHYKAERSGAMNFQRVPVDGSTKMPDAHMDAIEPFDYSELAPFSMGYLPGFLTDRYDQSVKQCRKRAKHRVKTTCVNTLQETVTGYAEVDVDHANAQIELNDVAYALLPVWMLHTKYNGGDYLFAMNGQTGQLVGDLPVDKGKVRRWGLTLFLPMAVALALIVNFTMGFGI